MLDPKHYTRILGKKKKMILVGELLPHILITVSPLTHHGYQQSVEADISPPPHFLLLPESPFNFP